VGIRNGAAIDKLCTLPKPVTIIPRYEGKHKSRDVELCHCTAVENEKGGTKAPDMHGKLDLLVGIGGRGLQSNQTISDMNEMEIKKCMHGGDQRGVSGCGPVSSTTVPHTLVTIPTEEGVYARHTISFCNPRNLPPPPPFFSAVSSTSAANPYTARSSSI